MDKTARSILHRVPTGGARNFHLGATARGLVDGSPPMGSRGETTVGGLRDEVPQKLQQFADIVYRS